MTTYLVTDINGNTRFTLGIYFTVNSELRYTVKQDQQYLLISTDSCIYDDDDDDGRW